MINHYRNLLQQVAPPTILVDMDGVIVDWDKGFLKCWNDRSIVRREMSYVLTFFQFLSFFPILLTGHLLGTIWKNVFHLITKKKH